MFLLNWAPGSKLKVNVKSDLIHICSRLSRLERENSSSDLFSRSSRLEVDEDGGDPEEVITYRVNGERVSPRNPLGDSNIREGPESISSDG